MNKVILIGRLTKDPEVKQNSNQTEFCMFSLAVDRRYKDADGNRQADFINCVAWRERATFLATYFKKGSKVGIVGNLQSRTYEGQDGKKVYVMEVVVDELEFVESKGAGSSVPPPPEPPQQQAPTAPAVNIAPEYLPDEAIDLPFEV